MSLLEAFAEVKPPLINGRCDGPRPREDTLRSCGNLRLYKGVFHPAIPAPRVFHNVIYNTGGYDVEWPKGKLFRLLSRIQSHFAPEAGQGDDILYYLFCSGETLLFALIEEAARWMAPPYCPSASFNQKALSLITKSPDNIYFGKLGNLFF